jgi:UDP-2,4-diacetamido-2,4,6-trideoxy-beta-L-altropyranose hydrolase
MRCLTLAEALRKQGAKVLFVCREHEGHLCGLIEERRFPTFRLPKIDTQRSDRSSYAAWLGTSWQEDLEQTRAAIQATGQQSDWLVVDHYGLDQRWESSLRSCVGRIMVIDDLADRTHDCDLLLDQNLVAQMEDRYAGKVPLSCALLLGPEYALLQPTYAELHDQVPAREGPIRRIFIFFGGVDSTNLTGRSLAAFLRLNRPDIDVDVVITADSPHAENIHRQVAGHSNIHIHSNLPSLASLMARADLAVGAGGATSWERLCLGLPSLVVTLAENQRPVTQYLHEAGLVHWIGHEEQVDQQTITATLARTLTVDSLIDWSRRCSQICNGQGVFLILESMELVSEGMAGGGAYAAKAPQS